MSGFVDRMPETASPELADAIDRIAGFGIALSARIARGSLAEALGAAHGDINSDGDAQKALDVISDDMARAALDGSAVRYFASEEQDHVIQINPAGTLAMVIDPLDGSSNIDANLSIGSIFGIFPAAATGDASVLRPARDLLASGYIIYGPQCCLILRVGTQGTRKFVLDPDARQFRDLGAVQPIPDEANEYAINASNYRHWSVAVRSYIDDRIAGKGGPLEQDFNMRWVASLVAETHRILSRGGIFLYPGDERKGYERGRLRLVYECGPIGHLVEGAGGRATDGVRPVLDLVPDGLHARTPFVFGSANKVDRAARHFSRPENETTALFSKRGLFLS
ncbi:MAG: class 1 fructose-bisphosphatase [Paracoccaceae bacterium]